MGAGGGAKINGLDDVSRKGKSFQKQFLMKDYDNKHTFL